jgi:2-oxoglutarate dehydrogenase E1 component
MTPKKDTSLAGFNFKDADLDIPIFFGDAETRKFIHPFMVEKEEWTVREIYAKLQQLYCGRFAIEYMHLVSRDEKSFLE